MTSFTAQFGIVEWFRFGDYAQAKQILAEILQSGATSLRTHISWAEFHRRGGQEWYDWLLPMLGEQIDLLPCIHYTPPSLSRTGRSNGPPRRLKDYADFVDLVLTKYGDHFRHIELWNEPNNLLDWDWRADPDFCLFCEMIGNAAYWAAHRGWHTVLGGPSPLDPAWLDLMGRRGLLDIVSAVGLHGFPGTWDSEASNWAGWPAAIAQMTDIVRRYNDKAEIWITETGYSTWRNDELEQSRRFLDAASAPVPRMYWYGWRNIPEDVPVQEGLQFDLRHYHMGLTQADGQPKLLARLLRAGSIEKTAAITALATPNIAKGKSRPIVVTGGCGFIGTNLADRLLAEGRDVLVVDNLARPGVEKNLFALRDLYGRRVQHAVADMRDGNAIRSIVAEASAIFHLAGQTAVTTSMESPAMDFEVNASGTINVLEAVRRSGRPIPVIYSSTNKVYGDLSDLLLHLDDGVYRPQDSQAARHGISERRPLDFHTPYGCSKGVADQYVLDYGRSYGIPTAVLRMSCIYGPRQFGTEDQGWVAHFLLRALSGESVSIYGNGLQVRDILHVDDAVRAYRLVLDDIANLRGHAFNLGGGPKNAVSLRAVIAEISAILGQEMPVTFHDWRPGDQRYFVTDYRKLSAATGWRPHIQWKAGLASLAAWLREHRVPETARLSLETV